MMSAIFWKGHASYLIGKLNWTPLPFEAKKSPIIPNKRYLHSAAIHEHRLYLLGGIDNDNDFRDSKMYCLDLQTMKWTTIEGRNFCESRNGHSCALFKNELYFFGGSQHQSSPTNDFFKFSPVTATWSHLDPEGATPSERQLALLVSMNDEFLFLYGGIDILEDKIFDDAYLFKNEQWMKLAIARNPSERIKMGVAVCGRRVFLFGGEGPSENGCNLYNGLFEAAVNEYELEVVFKEVTCHAGKVPQARTAHGMVAISERFFLVYGGEGEGNILGDIWIYDVQEMQWAEIETLFGTLTPRYQFSIAMHKNELLIFGGMNEEHAVLSDLVKLEFMQEGQQPAQICEQCQQQMQEKAASKSLNIIQPALSSGFYYNLAMEIAFPFRAIEMICEAAEELQSKWIKIYSSKTIEEFDYMNFEFDSPAKLHSSLFLGSDSSNPAQGNLLHNLKIAALRLGRTFLYIQACQSQRKVFLLSADSKYAPNFEQSFVQYSYIQSLRECETHYGQSFGDKQAVYNVLKSQIDDPYSLLSRNSGNLLVIFQINILPTVEKAYYYELIFYSHPDCDIKLYHNQKKSELLETLGYNITTLPDFSLRSYLQLSKLTRTIKTYINHDDSFVTLENYLDYLQRHKEMGQLEELQMGDFSSKLVQKCVVFRCTEGKYLQGNQGILVYCGNYLIDRYDCKLGQLICDKFYKKKYSKHSNIFKYTGLLFLSSALKLNHCNTKPQNRFKYGEIMEELLAKVKQRKGQEENQFSQLYNRLILSKENSKKVKRDS